MNISRGIINFSDCDDNQPNGEFTGLDAPEPALLFATAHNEYTCGNFYIAYDDTGESQKTGQGPYYLYDLGEL